MRKDSAPCCDFVAGACNALTGLRLLCRVLLMVSQWGINPLCTDLLLLYDVQEFCSNELQSLLKSSRSNIYFSCCLIIAFLQG